MLQCASPALQERLGPEATVGLLVLLETSKREWSTEVIEQSVERFERRLAEETSLVRVELKQEINNLRVEIKGGLAGLETTVERALLTQTRWMFGMWVGQLAATAAMMGAMFRIFHS